MLGWYSGWENVFHEISSTIKDYFRAPFPGDKPENSVHLDPHSRLWRGICAGECEMWADLRSLPSQLLGAFNTC